MPRIRVDLPLALAEGFRARCLEIAASGMRVRCQGLPPVGTEIRAVLQPDGARIEFRGEVVWRLEPEPSRGFPGEMGLLIRDPPAPYLELVSRLFAEFG